jgi:hypothetical protein
MLHNSKAVWIQIFLSLVLCKVCLCQASEKITYGNLGTMAVSVEEFKKQHTLKIPGNLILDSAIVYFSIPGKKNIISLNYYPHFDPVNFTKLCDLLVPGAWVTFNIFFRDRVIQKPGSVSLGYAFYGMTKRDRVVPSSPSVTEWKRLRELAYSSGTIYFSGTCFDNVIAFRVEAGNLSKLKELFDRCAPGSKITFENVVYTDEKQVISRLSKTFELE